MRRRRNLKQWCRRTLSPHRWDSFTGWGSPIAHPHSSARPLCLVVGGAAGDAVDGGVDEAKQPLVEAGGSRQLSREGAQYYLFGAPGSAACATLAKQDGTAPIPGEHCLLAGPSASVSDLRADLPPRTTMADGDRLTVPQGTVVLRAVNPTATDQISFDSPSARFYVLKDNVALTGNQVTDAHPSTDSGQLRRGLQLHRERQPHLAHCDRPGGRVETIGFVAEHSSSVADRASGAGVLAHRFLAT